MPQGNGLTRSDFEDETVELRSSSESDGEYKEGVEELRVSSR